MKIRTSVDLVASEARQVSYKGQDPSGLTNPTIPDLSLEEIEDEKWEVGAGILRLWPI